MLELDLAIDKLEQFIKESGAEWFPVRPADLRELFRRLREAEALRADAIETALDLAAAKRRIALLEDVRQAAQALADSGELGHWNHRTIVRVDGDRALDLGAALAAVSG